MLSVRLLVLLKKDFQKVKQTAARGERLLHQLYAGRDVLEVSAPVCMVLDEGYMSTLSAAMRLRTPSCHWSRSMVSQRSRAAVSGDTPGKPTGLDAPSLWQASCLCSRCCFATLRASVSDLRGEQRLNLKLEVRNAICDLPPTKLFAEKLRENSQTVQSTCCLLWRTGQAGACTMQLQSKRHIINSA